MGHYGQKFCRRSGEVVGHQAAAGQSILGPGDRKLLQTECFIYLL